MGKDVKARSRRRYASPQREGQAATTRRAVLTAARDLFVQQGYASTSVGQIAARAGVAVDTVYASAGRKPALLREVVETALSGTDHAIPAEEREYVRSIRAAGQAVEKVRIYASAVTEIGQRMAPIHRALREAAATDPDCATLREQISARRAANMRLFAADLHSTGALRADRSDDEVADILWSMNAAEYYALLVSERGWSPARFQRWLTDAWTRALLVDEHS